MTPGPLILVVLSSTSQGIGACAFLSDRACGMSEKIWYLKQCDLFQRLSSDELTHLETRSRIRQFPKGSPIYLPADQADGVLLVASGRVKICSFTEDGRQTILAFVEPGELFGELALLEPGEREEFAEAAEKSDVILIPADAMRELAERNTAVSLGVTRLFGLRRRRIERRLKYLLFRTNRERLIHLLLELAEDYGRQLAEGVELGIKLAHQDLASIIGSTRETVTVLLGELQSQGLLKLGRRKIILTDLTRLAQSVNTQAHGGRKRQNSVCRLTEPAIADGDDKV
jgi:CRP-like cAMP-binding protein